MTIRFYLHNNATEGRHPIYIEVRWAKHPAAEFGTAPVVRMGVRESVLKKYWTSKQRVSTQDQRATRINRKLGKLYKVAEDLLDDAERDKLKVSPEQMRTALLAELNLVEAPTPTSAAEEPEAPAMPTICSVATDWKTFYKAKHTPNYLRKIDPVVTHWEAFRPGTTLEELLPDPKTKRSDLVEQWCNYLIDEAPTRTGGIGLESNTVGRYLKGLRALLKFAGHPFAWLTDEYSYEVEIEPLRFEEVMQLYQTPMPTEHLTKVRDVFVFNCFTGPRFGNLRALEPSDVVQDRGDYILEYVQFKGQRKKLKVRVALDDIALEIWQRYHGRLPVPVSQEMNESIKEAAQAAGLTRPIKQVRQRGPHRVERRGPLWEFITAHVARHTFATMLLDGDADLGQVQDSLGHSAIQTTRRYAKSREQKRHQATKSAFQNLRASHTESPSV
ncbi:site-specific integrase [Hymenobacter sp. HSC-4F20]|uniref:site-specific integrase n=1 Tax=Hymenobacter sp. HSC-4F20 TaxID=2864135 RepID=UPI001C733F9B|nr:site-specific integrase [Hymenobacter sp. HSC-4F20]MBX0290992.1 site-specific integrase [Hymenobacter sp. HSC-4F20]